MKATTVIFDMDGLLIDSEPLWEEAGAELLQSYGVELTSEQYQSSTGLRTREWITHWFNHFHIDNKHTEHAIAQIINTAMEKIAAHGAGMPGVPEIFTFLQEKGITMAIATSSPLQLVDIVVNKLNIGQYLTCMVSAEELPYGKPHPAVYLDCAARLGVDPSHCICFEDSFNGMIAVKAARMKCVVIPAPHVHHQNRWDAADLKLRSLLDFGPKELALCQQ
jgi:sugar-phosphatase